MKGASTCISLRTALAQRMLRNHLTIVQMVNSDKQPISHDRARDQRVSCSSTSW